LLAYGVPLLCFLMFMREMVVSYFVRPKFEMYVSEALHRLTEKIDLLEKSLVHSPSRMECDMTSVTKVSKIISSVRAKLLASRAYILRFHNGSSFSTNVPVWKFSMTNESTDSAISSMADCTRDMLVSNHIKLLTPVFDAEPSDGGVHIISKREDGKLDALRIDADLTDSNQLKGYLLLRGIKHLFYAPITDSEGRAVGVVCLDYNSEVPEFMDDEYATKELGELSSMISMVF